MTRSIDPELQAQVDAQLIEQGAFAPLELLFSSGRLMHADYESWRREEIAHLDEVLMGSIDKIKTQIEEATHYARSIGLIERPLELYSWNAQSAGKDKLLRISGDARLHQLIGSRYVPAREAPQMDLFFDNPVVALCNGIARALSARNAEEAQRQLDRLYALAPTHQDLPAFDALLSALAHLGQPIEDAAHEIDFVSSLTPTARRVLGPQARDLLSPLWRQIAEALRGTRFSAAQPDIHASFALLQAQEWAAAHESVLAEPGWQRHSELCLRLTVSGLQLRRRSEALSAFCHLCWQAPDLCSAAVERARRPELTTLWRRFLDSEEDLDDELDSPLTEADFPAWLLLDEPGLASQLPVEPPGGTSTSEEGYRLVHRWIHARRAGDQTAELAQRKALRASQPALFRLLMRRAQR